MAIITISRTTGSNGDEIAHLTASSHGMKLLTRELAMREWLPSIATPYELHMLDESPRFFMQKSKSGEVFAEFLEKRLREEVADTPAVILGMASQAIFANRPDSFNVRITASDMVRLSRLSSSYGLGEKEAARLLELSDRKHHRYINTIYGKDWVDPTLYHMTLNTDKLSIQEASEMIVHSAGLHDVAATQSAIVSGMTGMTGMPGIPGTPGTPGLGFPLTSGIQESNIADFKHPSEQEFARILDMYNIQWIYEPRTFPVEWDAEGSIKMAFTPDFYLPRFDTYIELTTMDQKYVSEKKRKVRRMKELYPDVKINIIFKDDYHSLLKRFQRG